MIACSLLMAHRLGFTVAGAGAVLAFLVSVAFTVSATMGTCERIERFTVNRFRVGIPPSHTAFVRAEALLLGPGGVDEQRFTLSTEGACSLTGKFPANTTEIVAATERFHRVLSYAK